MTSPKVKLEGKKIAEKGDGFYRHEIICSYL